MPPLTDVHAPTDPAVPPAPGADACANCGATLGGRYCSACGQRRILALDSTAAFLREALGDAFSLDSRLVRSVRALFLRPGLLTTEFLAGRRQRYTSPVQLYLLAAAAFFLVASVRPFLWLDPENVRLVGALPGMKAWNDVSPATLAELEAAGTSLELFALRFGDAVNRFLPAFLVGSVALFSLFVYALCFRRERRYLAHAVFALHWTAFYLCVMALFRLFPPEWRLQDVSVGVAWLWLALALRRVHALHAADAVVRSFVLVNAFLVLLLLWVQATTAVGLLAL